MAVKAPQDKSALHWRWAQALRHSQIRSMMGASMTHLTGEWSGLSRCGAWPGYTGLGIL